MSVQVNDQLHNITQQKCIENRLEYSDLVALIDVYLCEWQHRDELLWSQSFRMFYVCLIVIMLPNIGSLFGFEITGISYNFFRIIGLILSFVFLFVALGYAKRLKASSDTYKEVIKLLPNKEYQRVSIEDITLFRQGKIKIINYIHRKLDGFLNWRISTIMVIFMFVVLIIIAVFMLFWGDHFAPIEPAPTIVALVYLV